MSYKPVSDKYIQAIQKFASSFLELASLGKGDAGYIGDVSVTVNGKQISYTGAIREAMRPFLYLLEEGIKEAKRKNDSKILAALRKEIEKLDKAESQLPSKILLG